jgi:hypothetical protein
MAYKGYQFRHSGTVGSLWACMTAFMTDIGWEMHDDIAENIKVYKSNGESGNEPYGYVYIQQEAAYIGFRFYRYWDATAHVGYMEQVATGTTAPRLTVFSTQGCILCGDKDIVGMIAPAEYNPQAAVWFGHAQGRIDNVVVGADGTAGTSGTLAVSTTAGLYVGQSIQILGSGTEGCEWLDIIELTDANTIKVKALSQDYGTGSKIGVPASTFGFTVPISHRARWYATTHISDSGTSVQSAQFYTAYKFPAILGATQLNFNKKATPSATLILTSAAGTTGFVAGYLYRHYLWVSSNTQTIWDASIYNTTGEYGTSATASTSSANTLVETGRTWATDQHVNRHVLITAGTGIGQSAKITGNDATSLTIAGTWGTTFGTSRYQICDQLYRHGLATIGYSNSMMVRITDTIAPSLS